MFEFVVAVGLADFGREANQISRFGAGRLPHAVPRDQCRVERRENYASLGDIRQIWLCVLFFADRHLSEHLRLVSRERRLEVSGHALDLVQLNLGVDLVERRILKIVEPWVVQDVSDQTPLMGCFPQALGNQVLDVRT